MGNDLRPAKGSSLLELPESFCVIDIESTGLMPCYDEIIEISAIRVSGLTVTDTFSSLVKPHDEHGDGVLVDDFIESLTGISNAMLEGAPYIESVLPLFFDFIGDSVLIGHNVNFDINFIYDYSDGNLKNNFVDTMRLFRLAHSELPHHRLRELCEYYHVENENAHRSLSDCFATFSAYIALRTEILNLPGGIADFCAKHTYRYVKAADISTKNSTFDELHPLFGKTVVFTGVLEKMVRRDAMQLVADFGGINGDNVTKNTNYLVLGNNDYCSLIKGGKSSKHKKAEALKLKGFDIEIMPESVFYDMLGL